MTNKPCSLFLTFLFFVTFHTAFAKTQAAGSQVVVETAHTAIVFSEDAGGHLLQSYFGSRLQSRGDYFLKKSGQLPAYPAAGMNHIFENAIALTHADGNRSLDLHVKSVNSRVMSADLTETRINLYDDKYAVEVALILKAYNSQDVIGEQVEVIHHESGEISLSHFASSSLFLDASHYYLTQFHGNWAEEMQMQESELTSGIKIIDSKLGVRAAMMQSPSFMLSIDQASTESSGEVIGGTLAWSGNFQLLFEVEEQGRLNVLAGMNPYESAYRLKAGEKFNTPEFLFSYSREGKGAISRNFHSWGRKYGLNEGDKGRMILLNNWESTYFDFDEKKLTALFDDARNLGVDLFLLDDGWFANKYPRNDDRAGLGDWQENKAKLPSGISYLVTEASKRNLKFGIWIEPEMVNPKSELFETHPEWVLRMPNRPEALERNQLVLDLSNPAVQEFVFQSLSKLVSGHPGLAYIKWDCNRYLTNAYSAFLGKDRQNQLYIDYVRGLYKVMDRFHSAYPHFQMMLCSGGGGRTDYGALKYFTEYWASDMTDPVKRFFIQWGYTYFFPSIASCNHVTDAGTASFKFKLDVAMMGKMGFDIVPGKLPAADLELARSAIKTLRQISPVIWYGNLYRLISPYASSRAALMYTDKDQAHAVLFAYRFEQKNIDRYPRVRLQGLDASAKYKITETNTGAGHSPLCSENGQTLSGDFLMNVGLELPFRSDYSSAVVLLDKI